MDGSGVDLCLEHRRHSPPRELSSPPIPDELLLDIFRRIHSPADLVRTSAACVSFHRLIADHSFVRRFRKLHAPPLLGFLERERKVFHLASPPHPSAPESSAAALAADFSFSFLPAPASEWLVRDSRDGRVLLDRPPEHGIEIRYSRVFPELVVSFVFPELVVCDPLHRRYLLLPPVPDNLAVSMKYPVRTERGHYYETFLAPPVVNSDDEASAAEETSFSVFWMAQCEFKLVAFVFSSRTGQWRSVSSRSWSNLVAPQLGSIAVHLFARREYAYGCFYWVTGSRGKLLVLDIRRMEFFIADPPHEAVGSQGMDIAFVETGDGRAGMFVRTPRTNDLKYSIMLKNCVTLSSRKWQFERTVSLDFEFSVMGSAGRHLFLFQWQNKSCFSLDVRTFQLERVFVSDSCVPDGHMYSNFPPSLLSTPTIPSGLEEGAEKMMLEQGCAPSSSAHSSQPSE